MKDYGGIKDLDVIDIFYILFQLKKLFIEVKTSYARRNIITDERTEHFT